MALDCYDDVYTVVFILSRIVIFLFMYSSVPKGGFALPSAEGRVTPKLNLHLRCRPYNT